MIARAVLLGWALLAVCAGFWPDGVLHADPLAALQPPSWAHWLGTDPLGRDVLARLCGGARTALAAGVGGAGLAGLLGLCVGAAGGRAASRAAALAQGLPTMFALLWLRSLWPGGGLGALVGVLGLVRAPEAIRAAHAAAAQARAEGFVEAARALGATEGQVLWTHVLPRVADELWQASLAGVAPCVLAEGALSFLGLGVPPPTPSWGELLLFAREVQAPWLLWPPLVALASLAWAASQIHPSKLRANAKSA